LKRLELVQLIQALLQDIVSGLDLLQSQFGICQLFQLVLSDYLLHSDLMSELVLNHHVVFKSSLSILQVVDSLLELELLSGFS
jgi:phosphoribosylformylglycinamidine (FGAM) synthase-like amidotransferase family enzyme